MTRDECVALVGDVYRELAPSGNGDIAVTSETRLFGGDSSLDSSGLVALLVEVEQRVNEQCNTEIVIADDRAVSQQRSPFRSIGSLADYVLHLLSDQDRN